MGRVATLLLVAAVAAVGGAQAAAQELKPEEVTVARIPADTPKVYLADIAINHIVDGRLYILDAGTLRFLGLVGTGFAGTMYLPHHGGEIYTATTYYAKLTRGERLDLLEVRDASTLELKAEIPLPNTRAQALNYRPLMQGSADDRFVFIQNATPGTSITVVDMKAGKVSAEISNDGCYGTYPAAGNPLRYVTICGDGSFGTYTLAADGTSAERRASTPLFDPDEDPLFIHAERAGDDWLFVSFAGTVYRINLEGETARLVGTFPLAGGVEGSWRPGGYQPIAYLPTPGVLFVLMHSGGAEGSHKNPAEEIWAVDAKTGKLLSRSPCAPLTSLTVGSAGTPTLFGINPIDATVVRYQADPAAGFAVGEREVEQVGEAVVQVEAD
ncbi:methylamine dehydrogenase heavy chain [Tistlia consotensis]|uniref:Methylamine dehydrogenase heavy chain n=1 Tax=Tistlia consotensis USBA 355 TaxID=560819 RepID=A0A1Y6BCQ1_9PROT|nr:amine dehydrogenase large subunit [Tistlia consotensis]SME97230.1 methylamine dehydrogenase heavy chain [Tistlia consotensis USBA 355]SNR56626.1 methylamine dehydrogenase heavy chain [Tistlia consotensis]